MKDYLLNLIDEEINRCFILKDMIRHPLTSELESLSTTCSFSLDSKIEILKGLKFSLKKSSDIDDIRIIFRQYRRTMREVEEIEQYGVSPLHFHQEDMIYLNKLLRKIIKEINLPLVSPTIASFSDKYFFYVPATNVIFLPLCESEFLLHLPDIYHELGHYVLLKKDELSLSQIQAKYQDCIEIITDHYAEILSRRLLEESPNPLRIITKNIHKQWKDSWFEEFFCDSFATYLLGPAYVWSHLHLTIKKSADVCNFYWKEYSIHPSDESRLRIMLLCLKKMGFKEESRLIKNKWNSLLIVKKRKISPEYEEAYPNKLLEKISEHIYEGMIRSKFNAMTRDKLNEMSDEKVIKILNLIWIQYWGQNIDFRKIEKEYIEKIKKNI